MSPEAANSMLKTLEEPPSTTVIILTAPSTEHLPSTIVSRSQIITFQPLPQDLLSDEIAASHQVEPDRAHLAASLAGGTFKGADQVDPESLLRLRDEILAELRQLKPTSPADLFDLAHRLTREAEIDLLLGILVTWYRDLLVSAAGAGIENLINRDQADRVSREAERSSLAAWAEKLTAVFEARAGLEANANARLNLEALMLRLQPIFLADKTQLGRSTR
jgi:DNA polymerase-3 subunit delta'